MNTIQKNYMIDDIQALTEAEAAGYAEDKTQIKGHTVYFVDFPGYFGYSALVFAEGRHIYHANDYELHHRRSSDQPSGKTHDELRAMYVDALQNKLYTEEEIAAPLESYKEYSAKSYYLHSYYGMRRENVTIFCINPTEEQKKYFDQKTQNMTYDPVGFCYMDDADFVRRHVSLMNTLEQRYAETAENYEYQKSAFYYELGNHEYHINTYQGDWDTLSAFGPIKWHGQGPEARQMYYDELGFNEIQRRAFEDARREFLHDALNSDWY